jgi:hypothetical protein
VACQVWGPSRREALTALEVEREKRPASLVHSDPGQSCLWLLILAALAPPLNDALPDADGGNFPVGHPAAQTVVVLGLMPRTRAT